jgi:hypothetical protein
MWPHHDRHERGGPSFQSIPAELRRDIDKQIDMEEGALFQYLIDPVGKEDQPRRTFWFHIYGRRAGGADNVDMISEPLWRFLMTGIHVLVENSPAVYERQCAVPEIDVYIFFVDRPKCLPKPDRHHREILDWKHVNSAFTYPCPGETGRGEIYIFRSEEWPKVFLHECIHLLGIDFAHAMAGNEKEEEDDMNSRLVRHFLRGAVATTSSSSSSSSSLSSSINLNFVESYTEFLAEQLMLMISSPSWSIYKENLLREQMFSCLQAAKIIHYASDGKGTYETLLSAQTPRLHYREKTSAFAYYVLKSILMWNSFRLFDMVVVSAGGRERGGRRSKRRQRSTTTRSSRLRSRSRSSKSLSSSIHTPLPALYLCLQEEESFVHFLVDHSRDPSFLDVMEEVRTFFDLSPSPSPTPSSSLLSLRMMSQNYHD